MDKEEAERKALSDMKSVSGAWDSIFDSISKTIEDMEKQETVTIEDILEEAKMDGIGRVIVVQKAIVKHQDGDISFETVIHISKHPPGKGFERQAATGITIQYLPPLTKECMTC